MRLHDVSKGAGSGELPVLTEEQLRQLQKVSLMMLDDIDSICRKNGLTCLLIGGSAIGALRHKGFIPWDDDIDIAMTRKDYLIFAKKMRETFPEKYSVSDARDDDNYGRLIPKVRLKGTTYRTVLEHDLQDCGVRIDIFLIENTYDNAALRWGQGAIALFFGFALSCRRLYRWREEFKGLQGGASFKIKKCFGFLFSFASLQTWARWTDAWNSVCKNDASRYVSVPTDGLHFFGELEKREDLCKGRTVDYEGRKVFIPAAAEPYLKKHYGDFMAVPPENKRLRSKYLEFDLGQYADRF